MLVAALIHSRLVLLNLVKQLQKVSNGSSVLSVFVKEFANVYIAHELCSRHFPEKSAALNASHETLRAGQGLPQEKVPDGYVRISPSLSCNTEFPSIMFLSVLLVCPVENA